MKLESLPKTTAVSRKRVGRGYGSGKGGHTVGRGQKGQKTRRSIPIWFEGGQLPFIRRLPFIKGKNRFKSLNQAVTTLNVSDLENLKAGSIITTEFLVKAGKLKSRQALGPIKILGRGKLTKPFTVKLPLSKQAEAKIVKAGGGISPIHPQPNTK